MKTQKLFNIIVLSALCLWIQIAFAQASHTSNWFSSAREHLTRPIREGQWDFYLTGYNVHSGNGYSKSRRKALNNGSYGGGIGKRWADQNGNEDSVYALAFLDSHKKIEPFVGYAHQWFTPPVNTFSLGAGFTLALTARADILHYCPLPALLPLASIRYKKISLMGTILPRMGRANPGTIAFFWARYSF